MSVIEWLGCLNLKEGEGDIMKILETHTQPLLSSAQIKQKISMGGGWTTLFETPTQMMLG